jgi:hypothetical protein
MVSVVRSVVVAQPAGEVFAWIADLENEARWRLEVLASEHVGGPRWGRGARYRQRVRPLARSFETTVEVTGFEMGRWLAFEERGRPSRVRVLYSVEPVAGGARVTCAAVVDPARPVAGLGQGRFARVLESRIDFDLEHLRAVLEGSAAGEPRALPATASRGSPARPCSAASGPRC